jgi:hypothetical protein
MSERVERVARAIFNASAKNAGRSIGWSDDWPDERIKAEAEACARAAIEECDTARLSLFDEMREALAFYADAANWRQGAPATDWIPILDDCGEKARAIGAEIARIEAVEKAEAK